MHQAPCLIFDPDLAIAAQKWANSLAISTDIAFSDTPCTEILIWDENDIKLMFSDYATDYLYQEYLNFGYDFENPGAESNPGVDYWITMMWKGTQRFGCGLMTTYVICHYCEKGAWPGHFRQNVLPATMTMEEAYADIETTPCRTEIPADEIPDNSVPDEGDCSVVNGKRPGCANPDFCCSLNFNKNDISDDKEVHEELCQFRWLSGLWWTNMERLEAWLYDCMDGN